jgi:F-type H+-transporting ATPase subunit b
MGSELSQRSREESWSFLRFPIKLAGYTSQLMSNNQSLQLYMAIMSSFSFLAIAAAQAVAEGGSEGGLGLNTDILDTNLINLVIIIAVLFFFGRKFLGNTLTERRSKIEEAIQDAEKRQQEAATALADAQQKLAQAQAEAERIRASAEENAQAAKASILEASRQDVERMKETAVKNLNAEREKAIAELRQRVATMALQRVEGQLKERIDEQAQQNLIDRSIATIGR